MGRLTSVDQEELETKELRENKILFLVDRNLSLVGDMCNGKEQKVLVFGMFMNEKNEIEERRVQVRMKVGVTEWFYQE